MAQRGREAQRLHLSLVTSKHGDTRRSPLSAFKPQPGACDLPPNAALPERQRTVCPRLLTRSREPSGPVSASKEVSSVHTPRFLLDKKKMYVRVRKAGKRGEGGSKLVLAQKRLEGLRKLSKLQHFSERKFGPRRRRERDFPKARVETHRGPYIRTVRPAPRACQAGPQRRGPNLPQPWSAWENSCFFPELSPAVPLRGAWKLRPSSVAPRFRRRICSETNLL